MSSDTDTDPPPDPIVAALHNCSMALQGIEHRLGAHARADARFAKQLDRMEANIKILVEGQRKVLLRLGEDEEMLGKVMAAVGGNGGKRTQ